jgi:hypothetical protein
VEVLKSDIAMVPQTVAIPPPMRSI